MQSVSGSHRHPHLKKPEKGKRTFFEEQTNGQATDRTAHAHSLNIQLRRTWTNRIDFAVANEASHLSRVNSKKKL